MSLKSTMLGAAAAAITSPRRRALARGAAALRRQLGGQNPVVHYFHQADDPYSHLLCQSLPAFAARYAVTLKPWLAPPPDAAAAPERERLRAFGLRDAALVAAKRSLDFPPSAVLPNVTNARAAEAALASILSEDDFPDRALAIGRALWTGERVTAPAASDVDAVLQAGAAERERLGHYLGGMLQFEGEWYWGVDRLGYLEQRLAAMGLDSEPGAPLIAPFLEPALDTPTGSSSTPTIELWFSFRSPYSWLVLPRIRALAQHHGARLELRAILPMVMRGLPIPRAKGRYIVMDCKREAERLGLPFGRIVDPVGAGAERALAVLHHAIPLSLGETFAELGLRAAWADGIALAEDDGLFDVARRAGLSEAQVRAALADESWREATERNRADLFDAGLWGPPTFRLNGGEVHWGQDRLWALEDELRRLV